MRFHHQTKQPMLYLVIDDNQAALVSWDTNNHATHPFVVTSYTALPSEWFLHGAPWHLSSLTTYLRSYVSQHHLKKPLLVCACSGATTYEKTIALTHAPTQAAIPPDKHYAHYAWHTTSLPTGTVSTISEAQDSRSPHEPVALKEHPQTAASYLINGMPLNDILRLRLCADKSGCTLHRVTTLRASMQPLYTYCQQHGITPAPTQESSIRATATQEGVQHTSPQEAPSCDTSTHEATQHTTTNPDDYSHEITHHTSEELISTSSKTLLTMLCAPLPETHNHHLVLSALGLSLFERNRL